MQPLQSEVWDCSQQEEFLQGTLKVRDGIPDLQCSPTALLGESQVPWNLTPISATTWLRRSSFSPLAPVFPCVELSPLESTTSWLTGQQKCISRGSCVVKQSPSCPLAIWIISFWGRPNFIWRTREPSCGKQSTSGHGCRNTERKEIKIPRQKEALNHFTWLSCV